MKNTEVFLEMDLSSEEREARKAIIMKLKEERIQKERQQEWTVWQQRREVSKSCEIM